MTTDDEREAQAEAERLWPIHPHGVTDTRDVPDLMRYRSCFVTGATWAFRFRRQGPITEAQVKAATFSVMDWGLSDVPPALCESIARNVLEAAREVS